MSGMLQQNFKNELNRLKSEKEEKNAESLYSLSHYVFNLNFIDEYNFIKKTKLSVGNRGIADKHLTKNPNETCTTQNNMLINNNDTYMRQLNDKSLVSKKSPYAIEGNMHKSKVNSLFGSNGDDMITVNKSDMLRNN